MDTPEALIYTDGGARSNPGPAAIGCVIVRKSAIRDLQSEIIWEHGEYIGSTTNNQAEYRALICALEKASELGFKRVQCFLDSELVVRQLKGEYRVKEKGLQALYLNSYSTIQKFERITFTHIPRFKNKHADRLVNQALDKHD